MDGLTEEYRRRVYAGCGRGSKNDREEIIKIRGQCIWWILIIQYDKWRGMIRVNVLT